MIPVSFLYIFIIGFFGWFERFEKYCMISLAPFSFPPPLLPGFGEMRGCFVVTMDAGCWVFFCWTSDFRLILFSGWILWIYVLLVLYRYRWMVGISLCHS